MYEKGINKQVRQPVRFIEAGAVANPLVFVLSRVETARTELMPPQQTLVVLGTVAMMVPVMIPFPT